MGIMARAVRVGRLLVTFCRTTNALINLFAVCVFMPFTHSQEGMVAHWRRLRTQERSWLRRLLINGVGPVATGLVALVVASMKFLDGAWIVVVLIPLLVALFPGVSPHYQYVERARVTTLPLHPKDIRH